MPVDFLASLVLGVPILLSLVSTKLLLNEVDRFLVTEVSFEGFSFEK